jgi:hypothetical protein
MKNHINIPKPTAQSFIEAAPDAKPPEPVQSKKDQTAISLKLPTALLARIDTAAARFSVSRAAYMKAALSMAVEKDVV